MVTFNSTVAATCYAAWLTFEDLVRWVFEDRCEIAKGAVNDPIQFSLKSDFAWFTGQVIPYEALSLCEVSPILRMSFHLETDEFRIRERVPYTRRQIGYMQKRFCSSEAASRFRFTCRFRSLFLHMSLHRSSRSGGVTLGWRNKSSLHCQSRWCNIRYP